jgi:hypothetical protein
MAVTGCGRPNARPVRRNAGAAPTRTAGSRSLPSDRSRGYGARTDSPAPELVIGVLLRKQSFEVTNLQHPRLPYLHPPRRPHYAGALRVSIPLYRELFTAGFAAWTFSPSMGRDTINGMSPSGAAAGSSHCP